MLAVAIVVSASPVSEEVPTESSLVDRQILGCSTTKCGVNGVVCCACFACIVPGPNGVGTLVTMDFADKHECVTTRKPELSRVSQKLTLTTAFRRIEERDIVTVIVVNASGLSMYKYSDTLS